MVVGFGQLLRLPRYITNTEAHLLDVLGQIDLLWLAADKPRVTDAR